MGLTPTMNEKKDGGFFVKPPLFQFHYPII